VSGTVTLGDATITVAAFSGRKAIIATRIVRRAMKQYPEILAEMAAFRAKYEAENVSQMDRAEAVFRFGDRVKHLSDADWEKSGEKLRLGQAATTNEMVAAIFPMALDAAEDEVLRLLALAVIPSGDLKRAKDSGGQAGVDEVLLARGEELLDEATDAADLVELAVVTAETLRDQFAVKSDGLGPRVGKLMEAVGLKAASPSNDPSPTPSSSPTDGPSEPKLTSSTGSAPVTAGLPA
jgi:hypothetical protein